MKSRKFLRHSKKIKNRLSKESDPNLLKSLAAQHYRAGRLKKALKCYEQAVYLVDDDADLYNNIGILHDALGDKQKAKACYNNALVVQPNHAQANYNLGNVYRIEGCRDKAISLYERALKVNPGNADCLNNLGNIYKEEKRYTEAMYCYRRALAINPNQVGARINNGLIQFEQGNIDEAISSYLLALEIEPLNAEGYIYLADAILIRDGLKEWELTLEKGLGCPQLNMTQKVDLSVSKTICEWLQGNLEKVKESLNEIEPLLNQIEGQGYLKNRKAYFHLLKGLINLDETEYVPKDTGFPEIHLIGDSHCLPVANSKIKYHDKEYVCKSHLIIGCKSWHLAQEKNNRYKYAVKKIIEKIPENSLVVFVIGEIDCRFGEGIYPYCIKNNVSFDGVITATVQGYVATAIHISKSKKIIPIFYGVAAPHVVTLGDSDLESQEMYLDVVRKFNESLSQAVIAEGAEFLDSYEATRGKNGVANQKFHIDECHMKPGFFQFCIENFLKSSW